MDVLSYALAKKYTNESISGISGTLAGKNCTIQSIVYDSTNSKNTVTFKWTADDGTAKTDTMEVFDGKEIVSAAVDANNHIIFTFSDASTVDAGEMPLEPVKVSAESGNAAVMKADGIYVSSTGVQVSADAGNTLVTKADGLYVPATDISGKVDKVAGKGLSTVDFTDASYVHTDNNYTTAEKTAVGTIADKVDKVAGKGLSTNDYDATEKAEVAKVKDKLDANKVVTSFSATTLNTNVPSEKLVKDNLDTITQELAKKVAIAQGEANKGKALIVGNDGNVTCGTVATDNLTIVDKTQAQYDVLTDAEKNDATKLYNITDADDLDLTNYAKKSELDAISSVVTGMTKIKKIVTVMASSTTSQPVGSNEIVTLDLTSYGFTKVPKAFLVGTYVNTSLITYLTTTQMKVQLINVYSTARSDMKAQYHLIEFE